MKTKTLANDLAAVACKLSEDDFFTCDIVVSASSITCCNWEHGMISTPALLNLAKYCDCCRLVYYVDFEDKKLVVYG